MGLNGEEVAIHDCVSVTSPKTRITALTDRWISSAPMSSRSWLAEASDRKVTS